MELFHFHDPHGNFGDDLNLWIWDRLLPGWREALPGQVLVGVGTLINNQLPRGPRKIVVGSGVGYGALPDAELMAECRFFSVRGPHSAKALGLPPERGIVDPAVMLPEFPEFQDIPKSGPPIFVPHHRSTWRHDWGEICRKAGVDYVTPQDDARSVIRRLAAAPLVLAESMHAAIIADAFGTPWQPVVIAPGFLPSKWYDWGDSLGLTLEFPPLEPVSQRLRSLSGSGRTGAGESRGSEGPSAGAARPRAGFRDELRRIARTVGRAPAIRIERALAPARLGDFAKGPGQLSDRARLAGARTRYRAVLAEVMAEFGLAPADV